MSSLILNTVKKEVIESYKEGHVVGDVFFYITTE